MATAEPPSILECQLLLFPVILHIRADTDERTKDKGGADPVLREFVVDLTR
jgi:hypothetical protein